MQYFFFLSILDFLPQVPLWACFMQVFYFLMRVLDRQIALHLELAVASSVTCDCMIIWTTLVLGLDKSTTNCYACFHMPPALGWQYDCCPFQSCHWPKNNPLKSIYLSPDMYRAKSQVWGLMLLTNQHSASFVSSECDPQSDAAGSVFHFCEDCHTSENQDIHRPMMTWTANSCR